MWHVIQEKRERTGEESVSWWGRESWAAPGSGEEVGGNQGVVEERAGLVQPDRRVGEILLVHVVHSSWVEPFLDQQDEVWLEGRCCAVLFRNTRGHPGAPV